MCNESNISPDKVDTDLTGLLEMAKLIYWLSTKQSSHLVEKAKILNDNGFDVKFFKPDEQFFEEFYKTRSTYIFLDDSNSSSVTPILKRMQKDPNFNGVKTILTLANGAADLIKNAYFTNFRDIIPLDLSHQNWLERVQFSTGNQTNQLANLGPKLSLTQKALIFVPGKISWISPQQLCIESDCIPPEGTDLTIKGPIARWFHHTNLTVKVLKNKSSDLNTRYKNSMVCSWVMDNDSGPRKNLLIEKLRDITNPKPCKVYAAIKTQEKKNELANLFKDKNIKLYYPINFQAWINEPQYISPDFLIIEDKLFKEENAFVLNCLFSKLEGNPQVIILGGHFERSTIKKLRFPIRLTTLKHLTASLPDLLIKKHEKIRAKQSDPNRFFIPENHKFSIIEIAIDGQMNNTDQYGMQIQLPYQIHKYSLCRVYCDFLRKSVKSPIWAKICDSSDEVTDYNSTFPFVVNCAYSTNHHNHRKSIGNGMLKCLGDQIERNNTSKSNLKPMTINPVPTKVDSTIFEDESTYSMKNPYSKEPADTEYTRPTPRPAQKRKPKAPIKWGQFTRQVSKAIVTTAIFLGFWYGVYLLTKDFGNSGKIFSRNLQEFKSWDANPPTEAE